jgi:hypothetical protein
MSEIQAVQDALAAAGAVCAAVDPGAFAASPERVEAPRVRVGGLDYSLDEIEHGLLRGNASKFGVRRAPMPRDDPRLAHTPLAFDERVEQEGALVVLPRQFYWYREDFGGEQEALAFALGRLEQKTADLVDRRRGRVKLRYADFDWRLERRYPSEPEPRSRP